MAELGVVLSDGFPAGLRVFAVDDDVVVLRTLELMLIKCGYKVTVSDSALQALELLRANKGGYDIVITDVNMPEMDGFKLLEAVVIEMNLPVIMLSTDFDFQSVMKGIKYGAVDYLIKPVRLEELRLIWKHVAKRSLHHKKNDANESKLKDIQISQFSKKSKDGAHKRDEDDDTDSEDDLPSQKRARVSWTPELHAKFINALNQLGIDRAVPKKILDIMEIPGLTRENVASHLQKYRKGLKKETIEFNHQVFDNTGIRRYNGSSLSMAINRPNPSLYRNKSISSSYLPSQQSYNGHALIPRSSFPHLRHHNNFYQQYAMSSVGSQLGTQQLNMATNAHLMNKSTQLSGYQPLNPSLNRLDHHAHSSQNSWISDGHTKSNPVSQPESIANQQAANNFNELASLFAYQAVGEEQQQISCGSGANFEMKTQSNFNSMDAQISFDFEDHNGSNASDLVVFPEESRSTETTENAFEFVNLDYVEDLQAALLEFQQ